MPFSSLNLLSSTAQLVFGVLSIWIAIVILRQRAPAGWIVLSGAILSILIFLFPTVGRSLWFGGQVSMEIYYAFVTSGRIVAQFLFLGGLLVHLQRRDQEAKRIADLEAILQDRDGRP